MRDACRAAMKSCNRMTHLIDRARVYVCVSLFTSTLAIALTRDARAQTPIDTALASAPVELPRSNEPLSESAIWILAAKNAVLYTNTQYQASTGLFNSVRNYPYATMWDIASGLAVLYCSDALDLIDGDVYDRRMRKALKTLETLALYKDLAFNKNYHTATGAPAGRDDRDERARAYGY